MSVNFLWMQCRGRVMGVDNRLPIDLPPDLKHFREKTKNQIVVMGRKTWETLPPKYHDPASGRKNYVLTSGKGDNVVDATVIHDLPGFLKEHADRDVWVIGGSEVLNQFLHYADYLHVTEVGMTVLESGQKHYAPEVTQQYWSVIKSTPNEYRMKSGRTVFYTFRTYKRK